MQQEVTALDIATLVIAVCGAVTGVAALAWSVATHLLTGPRVAVELRGGFRGPANYSHTKFDKFDPTANVNAELLPIPIVVVLVRNRGRAPVSVTSWSVHIGDLGYGESSRDYNPALPYRLEGGETALWVIDLEGIVATMVAAQTVEPMYATVDLGTGKTAKSSRYSGRRLLPPRQ